MPGFLFKQKVVKIRLSWVVFMSDGPLDRDEPPDRPPDHRTEPQTDRRRAGFEPSDLLDFVPRAV